MNMVPALSQEMGEPILRDYESEEKCIAECLILLSLSGGGLCISATTASPAAEANKVQESSPFTVDAHQEPLILLPPPAQVKSYECNICGKTFSSFQALGGHKTSHREKRSAAADGTNTTAGINQKSHECSICHMVFQNGLALGGHKRKHYQGKITRKSAKKAKTYVPTDGAAAATPTDITAATSGITVDLPTDGNATAETEVTAATNGSTSGVESGFLILFGTKILID